MDRNKYAVWAFGDEDNRKLLEAFRSNGIRVPDEWKCSRFAWRYTYIVDLEKRSVVRVSDDQEEKELIHTGNRIYRTNEFIEEISSGVHAERIWKKLYRADGTISYEGFTENDKPYGAGKMFYPDGTTYREGIFGEKGLLSGVEYYDNGQVRFDGILKYHPGYGPNYPVYGRCYYRDGRLMYAGTFRVCFTGSLSYPHVEVPADYGTIEPGDRPRLY